MDPASFLILSVVWMVYRQARKNSNHYPASRPSKSYLAPGFRVDRSTMQLHARSVALDAPVAMCHGRVAVAGQRPASASSLLDIDSRLRLFTASS